MGYAPGWHGFTRLDDAELGGHGQVLRHWISERELERNQISRWFLLSVSGRYRR
jgi:hypothetical protein